MGNAADDAKSYAKGGADAGTLANKKVAMDAAAKVAAEVAEQEKQLSKLSIRRRKSLAMKGDIFKPNTGIEKQPWHDAIHSPAGADVILDPDETKLFVGTAGADSILTVTTKFTVLGRVDSVDDRDRHD